MTYMRTDRYDRDGNVYHYGQRGFDGQCWYEGCTSYKWGSTDYCMSHRR